MIVSKRDLEVVFYQHHDGNQMVDYVAIEVAGGRAVTTLTLSEFCELLVECRKEITRLHWQPQTNADLAQLRGAPANTA